jgi:hypothetical protein
VEIGLPEVDAKTDRNSVCNIGRAAEVRFQRSGVDLLDGLGQSLHRLTDYFKHEVASVASK